MFKKIRNYLNNKSEVTDLMSMLVITFGVTLLIAGLYLMATDASQALHGDLTGQSVISAISWIPGIPLYLGELAEYSLTAVGLVSWVIGFDFLLIGLGLWNRHRFARFAALVVFLLASCFQFVQFLLAGVLGSPTAAVETIINVILLYLIMSKVEIQGKRYPLESKRTIKEKIFSGLRPQ
jgi:hypothetical protein